MEREREREVGGGMRLRWREQERRWSAVLNSRHELPRSPNVTSPRRTGLHNVGFSTLSLSFFIADSMPIKFQSLFNSTAKLVRPAKADQALERKKLAQVASSSPLHAATCGQFPSFKSASPFDKRRFRIQILHRTPKTNPIRNDTAYILPLFALSIRCNKAYMHNSPAGCNKADMCNKAVELCRYAPSGLDTAFPHRRRPCLCGRRHRVPSRHRKRSEPR